MANRISREKQILILKLLCEGNSIRSTSRITGCHMDTVANLINGFGNAASNFLDDTLRNLKLDHLEVDEIWTFVAKKLGRVHRAVTQISTDGLGSYPDAVDTAFGPYAHHGVLIKDYHDEKSGRYAPPSLKGTKRNRISGTISARSICTSHVERHNLTIRTFMKRFTRLSLGFSKKLDNLKAAVAMFMAYYNFVWRTRHSDDSGRSGTKRPTAAMMAGVTDRLWKFEDLYREVIMYW